MCLANLQNKTEPNRGFQQKPNRNQNQTEPAGFFQNQNRTEVQKSIPHIPNKIFLLIFYF